MPTYWSKTLIPTSRQVPGEAEVPSHQLMLRAGFIRKLGAGVYDYLPLGLRSLKKVMAIVRQEMDAAGAVEVFLPTLQPVELWEQTGRRAAYGENLFVVQDRHGRKQALGPTHEEVITELVGAYIESYKQLPITLYQIQTKFRDEFRPRFGVLRSREFQMKDAYSFHLSLDGPGGLDETYQKQYDAYCRIFSRCGLPYEIVEAESGPIGGSASHEFMVPSPVGEDVILKSDKGNYAANVEKCETAVRPMNFEGDATGELEEIHTPGCSSIEDVTAFFKQELKTKLKPQNMLKTLLFIASTQDPRATLDQIERMVRESGVKKFDIKGEDWTYFFAVVRGDHQVNEGKLKRVLHDAYPEYQHLQPMEPELGKKLGFAVGYLGPQVIAERDDVRMIVDFDAIQVQFWVAGANKDGYHVKHFHWDRDVFTPLGGIEGAKGKIQIKDIRNAVDGDPSPENDGGVLRETKGIEIGHVFKLGCKYTEKMNVTVLDENNERKHPIMGCYGIGVNRILAAAIEREQGHDENGIIWPVSIAPYTVIITPIKYAPGSAVQETADRLAAQLEQLPGVDVLIDDRDERPGVKFKDADLIGIPLRITIGDKSLANDQVELKPRHEPKPTLVNLDEVIQQVRTRLNT